MTFRTHPIGVLATLVGAGLATALVLAQEPRPRQEQQRGQEGQPQQQAQPQHDQHRQHDAQAGRTLEAGQRHGQGTNINSAQDAAQARRLMETHGVSLGDAIRAAEQHCNGKAVYAEIMLIGAQSGQQGQDAQRPTGQQTGQQQPNVPERQQQPGQTGQQTQQPGQPGAGQMAQGGQGQLMFHIYCANQQNQLALVMIDGQNGQVRDTQTVASIQRHGGMPGQQQRQARAGRTPIERSAEFHFIRGSDVMGADVKSAQNEDLGNISNLAVSDEGQVAYAVLSSGGVLGMGAELRAVPWNALQFRENDEFLLNIDQNTLKSVRGFEDENWPRTADATLRGRTQPGQQEFRPAGMAENPTFTWRGDNLIGKPILDNRNEQIGTINDIAVDARRGQIGYVIVGYGGVAGIGDKLVAVPWNAFDRAAQEGFRLNVDKSRLESAPEIQDNWAMLTNRDFAMRTHQHFNARPYWEGGAELRGERDQQQRDMQRRDEQRDMQRQNRDDQRQDREQEGQRRGSDPAQDRNDQRDAGRGTGD